MYNKKFCVVIAAALTTMLMQPALTAIQPIPVYADTAYLPDAVAETYLTKVNIYARESENLYNQAGTDQAGLINRLNELYKYSMILYYLEEYKTTLMVGGCTADDSELRNYAETYLGMCERFDGVFSGESSQYVNLKIGFDEKEMESDTRLKKAVKKFCTKIVPEYLEKLLADLTDKTKEMKDGDKLAKYGVTMSNVCNMLNEIDAMSDNLTNVSPFKSEADTGTPIEFSSKLDTTTKFGEIQNKFKDLFAMGAQVLSLTGTSAIIKIDPSLGFVANMANVTESNGNVVIPDGVQLSQAYLAILAAGASYTPFSSYVGESSFMAALRSLVDDDAAVATLQEFYNDTKSFRKPLYKRVISNEGIPTGRAELLTIKDFLSDINSGAEGALVTISGKFVYDTNNNYWVYADTYSTNLDQEKMNGPADEEDFAENADDSLQEGSVSAEEAQEAQKSTDPNDPTGSVKVTARNSSIGDYAGITVSLGTNDGTPMGKTCVIYTFKSPRKSPGTVETDSEKAYIDVIIKDNGVQSTLKTEDVREKYKDSRLGKKGGIKEQIAMAFDNAFDSYQAAGGNHSKESFDAYNITKYEPFKDVMEAKYTPIANNGRNEYVRASLQFYEALRLLVKGISEPYYTIYKTSKTTSDTVVNAATVVPPTTVTTPTDSETVTPADPTTPESTESSIDGSTEPSTEASDEPSTEGSAEDTEDPSNSDASQNNAVTKTVNTTVNTTELSGMSMSAKDVTGIMADEIITSEDKMSEPVLLYGTKHARSVDNMTTLLLQNIVQGTVACKERYEESNDYLYVNSYGDIITDDGMVILPGIANPVMYKANAKYNPYTAAFMNYYPTVLENTNFFQVATQNDINKMLILNDSAELGAEGKIDPESLVTNKATRITSIHDVKPTAPISVPEMETTFYYNAVEKEELLGYNRLIFGDTSRWTADGTGMYSYTPLLIQSQLSCGGAPVFPYNVNDDRDTKTISEQETMTSYSCAEMIAQNMFHYLTTDESGQKGNLSRLNDNYIVYYFCVSNLNGTSNPLAYANNDTYSYDRYVDDAQLRKESTLFQVSETIMNTLGDSTQVIGINPSSQDAILGPVLAFLKKNWLMSLMLLAVVLLFSFAKVERNMLQSFILLCVCSLFAYAYVCVLPVYLPLAYNSIINNVSESLAYEIMAVKAETNDMNSEDTTSLDDAGAFDLNTSSLTLYRVSGNDLRDFYAGLGITEEDVVGGKTYVINQEAGLFVEGDKIKVNTDTLFKTLEITGTFESDLSGYNLEATKTVSNNVDYYTPYYAIINSFVDRLNDLTSVYNIPRSVTNYSEDSCKDNYLVYSYVNSMPFLTPGVYDAHTQEDTSALSEEQLKILEEKQREEAARLTEVFGEKEQASDWLGITWFFHDLAPDYQQTIWAQTMYDTGYYYYDEESQTDWVANEEKINDLCNYINSQTKKFVFKMESQIGTLSDDVMIKIISLRALTAFTQKVSDMGHWLYPFSLNYQEMSIRDVLNCTMTSDYYTFVGKNMNICAYILSEYGWFHLILFDVLVILLFLATTIIHCMVPLMYLLLGILLIAKMVTNSDVKIPLKGYIKCTLVTMLCSIIICAGVVLSNYLRTSVVCIYFMLVMLLIVLTVLVTIVTSLLSNIADFGNTALTAKTEGIRNTFNQVGYKVVTANISTRHASRKEHRRQKELGRSDIALKYSNDRPVDDFYDDYGHQEITGMQGSYGYYGDDYLDHNFDDSSYDTYRYDDDGYATNDYNINF